MRNFNVNVKKNKTEYNFMPTLQMYLLDCREPRPMVIVVPGGGYTEVCKDFQRKKSISNFTNPMLAFYILRFLLQD